MKRLLAGFLGLVTGIMAVAAGAAYWAYTRYQAPGPSAADTVVVIPKGAGPEAITRRLIAAGVVEDGALFRVALRLTGTSGRLKHGEYKFAKRVSMARLINRLVEGKTVLRRFTAVEGRTTHQILERLKRTEGLVGEITLTVGEGELMPDTYAFAFGDTRDGMIERMRKAMRTSIDELWEQRAPDLPLKSKREALILASIIEKETSLASERRRVAAVFVNRLRKGMRLQTDPTVIYGITKGKGSLGRRLLRKDLEEKTPYNTYRIKGLPPGPIANPSKASVAAALNPLKTKEIYFVADGTGGHVFAETLQQHNRNVARWRKIRRQLEEKARRKKTTADKPEKKKATRPQ